MARPLRIAYPGALYHITSRGNERKNIFRCNEDRHHFLRLLAKTIERFTWTCFAYCLMGNHFHLFVQTTLANISQGMKYLNGTFTQYFNWTHGRVGHLFQGRFDGRIVEKESYFLAVCRYIVRNPVKAGICLKAEDYPWSSYRATRGLISAPSFLSIDEVLAHFGSPPQAQANYEKFVHEGGDVEILDEVRGQIFLGSNAFIESFQDQKERAKGISRIQTNLLRPPLEKILREPNGLDLASKQHRYSTREIARALGLHQTTVARRLRNASRLGSDLILKQ